MHASLVPTANDLAGLLAYVLGNPFLFISSSTVMTSAVRHRSDGKAGSVMAWI